MAAYPRIGGSEAWMISHVASATVCLGLGARGRGT